jgi:D-methionine transport system substrate-binding protein
MEKVKSLAKQRGQEVKITLFTSGYDCLNALAGRKVDLSVSQHKPMLDDYNRENKGNLVVLGYTYVAPLGFYSQKIKSLAQLSNGDRIVIHEERDKRRRALQLLSRYGVIKLDEEVVWPTKNDIKENKHNLEFIEAPFSRPFLNNDTVTAIAFSAMPDFLNDQTPGRPKYRPLCQEEVSGPFVMVLAGRPSARRRPYLMEFVQDIQNLEIAQFLLARFEGTIIPVFDFDSPPGTGVDP